MAAPSTSHTEPTLTPTPDYQAASPKLIGVVLAAGRASRFGSDKRRAAYDSDHTLLSRSIQITAAYCAKVLVVNRPGDEEQTDLLGPFQQHPQVEQFIAKDALHGMGASLANAASRVLSDQAGGDSYDGLMVMLADMPYIRPETVEQLIANFQTDKIVIPSFMEAHKEKKWGNPVLFSAKWFSALQGLHGDRGAKSLIKANPCARIEVVVDDPGILRDVDSPEDLGQ